MEYRDLAKVILKNIGGRQNVENMTHCMTRLRLKLKNNDLINRKKLTNIKEISGVVMFKGECHLIMGPMVINVFEEMNKIIDESFATGKETQNFYTKASKYLKKCFKFNL